MNNNNNNKERTMSLEDVNLGLANYWKVTCLDADGNIKWEEEKKNLITTVGLNHILDTQFHASTQVTTWYIGLKGAGTPAAANTMASHSSWSELTGYSGETGTLGTLYGVVDFSAARAVISGDTLQVTVTVTAASA